mmetsp:Transcript_22385/g.60038  ORF Transcript_22385/g.60038 Transcript_22385/m.60038 type:complete len:203 (+) Transcript_22385:348-956(+)
MEEAEPAQDWQGQVLEERGALPRDGRCWRRARRCGLPTHSALQGRQIGGLRGCAHRGGPARVGGGQAGGGRALITLGFVSDVWRRFTVLMWRGAAQSVPPLGRAPWMAHRGRPPCRQAPRQGGRVRVRTSAPPCLSPCHARLRKSARAAVSAVGIVCSAGQAGGTRPMLIWHGVGCEPTPPVESALARAAGRARRSAKAARR